MTDGDISQDSYEVSKAQPETSETNPGDKNDAVLKLQAGDQSMIDEVILWFLPTAMRYARYFNRTHSNQDLDDLRGVAVLALVKAVHKLGDHPNPEAYIKRRISGEIQNFIYRNFTVRVPRTSYERKKTEVNIVSLNVMHESGEDLFFVSPPEDYMACKEILEKLTPQERKVLILKLQNRTLHEIGQEMGKSHEWVRLTLVKMRRVK